MVGASKTENLLCCCCRFTGKHAIVIGNFEMFRYSRQTCDPGISNIRVHWLCIHAQHTFKLFISNRIDAGTEGLRETQCMAQSSSQRQCRCRRAPRNCMHGPATHTASTQVPKVFRENERIVRPPKTAYTTDCKDGKDTSAHLCDGTLLR